MESTADAAAVPAAEPAAAEAESAPAPESAEVDQTVEKKISNEDAAAVPVAPESESAAVVDNPVGESDDKVQVEESAAEVAPAETAAEPESVTAEAELAAAATQTAESQEVEAAAAPVESSEPAPPAAAEPVVEESETQVPAEPVADSAPAEAEPATETTAPAEEVTQESTDPVPDSTVEVAAPPAADAAAEETVPAEAADSEQKVDEPVPESDEKIEAEAEVQDEIIPEQKVEEEEVAPDNTDAVAESEVQKPSEVEASEAIPAAEPAAPAGEDNIKVVDSNENENVESAAAAPSAEPVAAAEAEPAPAVQESDSEPVPVPATEPEKSDDKNVEKAEVDSASLPSSDGRVHAPRIQTSKDQAQAESDLAVASEVATQVVQRLSLKLTQNEASGLVQEIQQANNTKSSEVEEIAKTEVRRLSLKCAEQAAEAASKIREISAVESEAAPKNIDPNVQQKCDDITTRLSQRIVDSLESDDQDQTNQEPPTVDRNTTGALIALGLPGVNFITNESEAEEKTKTRQSQQNGVTDLNETIAPTSGVAPVVLNYNDTNTQNTTTTTTTKDNTAVLDSNPPGGRESRKGRVGPGSEFQNNDNQQTVQEWQSAQSGNSAVPGPVDTSFFQTMLPAGGTLDDAVNMRMKEWKKQKEEAEKKALREQKRLEVMRGSTGPGTASMDISNMNDLEDSTYTGPPALKGAKVGSSSTTNKLPSKKRKVPEKFGGGGNQHLTDLGRNYPSSQNRTLPDSILENPQYQGGEKSTRPVGRILNIIEKGKESGKTKNGLTQGLFMSFYKDEELKKEERRHSPFRKEGGISDTSAYQQSPIKLPHLEAAQSAQDNQSPSVSPKSRKQNNQQTLSKEELDYDLQRQKRGILLEATTNLEMTRDASILHTHAVAAEQHRKQQEIEREEKRLMMERRREYEESLKQKVLKPETVVTVKEETVTENATITSDKTQKEETVTETTSSPSKLQDKPAELLGDNAVPNQDPEKSTRSPLDKDLPVDVLWCTVDDDSLIGGDEGYDPQSIINEDLNWENRTLKSKMERTPQGEKDSTTNIDLTDAAKIKPGIQILMDDESKAKSLRNPLSPNYKKNKKRVLSPGSRPGTAPLVGVKNIKIVTGSKKNHVPLTLMNTSGSATSTIPRVSNLPSDNVMSVPHQSFSAVNSFNVMEREKKFFRETNDAYKYTTYAKNGKDPEAEQRIEDGKRLDRSINLLSNPKNVIGFESTPGTDLAQRGAELGKMMMKTKQYKRIKPPFETRELKLGKCRDSGLPDPPDLESNKQEAQNEINRTVLRGLSNSPNKNQNQMNTAAITELTGTTPDYVQRNIQTTKDMKFFTSKYSGMPGHPTRLYPNGKFKPDTDAEPCRRWPNDIWTSKVEREEVWQKTWTEEKGLECSPRDEKGEVIEGKRLGKYPEDIGEISNKVTSEEIARKGINRAMARDRSPDARYSPRLHATSPNHILLQNLSKPTEITLSQRTSSPNAPQIHGPLFVAQGSNTNVNKLPSPRQAKTGTIPGSGTRRLVTSALKKQSDVRGAPKKIGLKDREPWNCRTIARPELVEGLSL